VKSLRVEEMNVLGVTDLGLVLSPAEVSSFLEDVRRRKADDLAEFGRDELLANGDLEVVRDLARFGGMYFTLLENPLLNAFVDEVLNDKAVVHSYNAIVTRPDVTSDMLGYRYHRDQPFFKDTRTSVNVMIPLVDYSSANGSTQFVPSTHLFREMPSREFLERYTRSARGAAGQAFALDAALWHRAGENTSREERPIVTLKYTLAPFKQQVDFCVSAAKALVGASELVKARLGWNVRVCRTYEEFREPGDRRKFKSGQYDMSNTDMSQ
jgi:ectoine hydroxylase-related dioxygenase (phytanoyl-CoA dioxygenase family)